jgi:hypothetical protein
MASWRSSSWSRRGIELCLMMGRRERMSAGCGGVSLKVVLALKSKRRSVRGCHGGLRAGVCVEDETHWVASGALGLRASGFCEANDDVTLRKQVPTKESN